MIFRKYDQLSYLCSVSGRNPHINVTSPPLFSSPPLSLFLSLPASMSSAVRNARVFFDIAINKQPGGFWVEEMGEGVGERIDTWWEELMVDVLCGMWAGLDADLPSLSRHPSLSLGTVHMPLTLFPAYQLAAW